MDEYEVGLREYVRILWWGKWIILGVFAVVGGLAAVLTAGSPEKYRTEVLVTVERPAGAPMNYTLPSTDLLVEQVQDRKFLEQAVAGDAVTAAWLTENLGAKKQGAFVQLTVQGALPAPDRAGAAQRVAAAAGGDRPEALRIGYFGSYARGDWRVGTDLDRVAVVAQSSLPFHRRATAWDLTELPVPAELVVYTEEEWATLPDRSRFGRDIHGNILWVYERSVCG